MISGLLSCKFAAQPGKIESIDLAHQMIFGDCHRAEIGRKAALVRSSAVPSWLAPTKIRVGKMESRFAASLNGLLQQNLPRAEMRGLIQSPHRREPAALAAR